jgi:hypothetical protein
VESSDWPHLPPGNTPAAPTARVWPPRIRTPEKNRSARVQGWLLLVALFAAALAVWAGLLGWLVGAGVRVPFPLRVLPVLVLGAGTVVLVVPYLDGLADRLLRREIARDVVNVSGAPPSVGSGVLVGLSVSDETWRMYDGSPDWDIGFLLLEPGRLRYYGDRTRFGMEPEHVERMEIQPPEGGGPFSDVRLLLYWREPRGERSGVLNFTVRDRRSTFETRRRLEELRSRLEAWTAEPGTHQTARLPLPLPPLTTEENDSLRSPVSPADEFYHDLSRTLTTAAVVGTVLLGLNWVVGLRLSLFLWIAVAFWAIPRAASLMRRVAELRQARKRSAFVTKR